MSESLQPTLQAPLLVTGASGQMGRRVVELLLEAGVEAGTIVAATRTPEKLADFSARGVIVRYADFEDLASLATAFAGVDRLLLISTDVTMQGNRRLNQHLNAVKAAEQAGVSHVLYTSITNPSPNSPVLLEPDHRGTEEALRASSMGWTFLRNNIYADELPSALARAVQMGALYSAAGDGRMAYILREDCARAAAAALAQPFSGRRVLDITGLDALSQADLASIVSSITGKQVNYVPLSIEVLTQNLINAGLPPPIADLIASFDAGNAQGQFDLVTNTVEELTGRKPTRIADFLASRRDILLSAAQ